MAMQRMELHFIIDRHGNIQSIVKGVKGDGCKALVEQIKKLGHAVSESPTGEFFEGKEKTIIHIAEGKR